ncbi:MAG TPA: helix-hairpin-helix domain-containing protein [Gaiellales bacterium]|jgi:competence protein ComEA|nr:helix-hairpin-helix domain-containing protein [Gaiellales bacterium]
MPEFLLQRRRPLLVAAVALVLILLAGRFVLHAGTTTPAAPLPPPPTEGAGVTGLPSGRVVVDVVGAVRRPGLYRLEQGSRIADAVARAGGATRKADLAMINLAAPLADGEQVVVPKRGAPGASTAGTGGSSTPGVPAGPVHLNTATLEQLDSLPGIGPVTAQKILDYRQEHGAFSSVDELDAVPGIGPARMDTLRDLVAP